MECNKDEAVRAKEIAERKFTNGDFSGAKKFVLKAQNLYPGLEDLTQMLMTLEVYISAENKLCGEADWYGILGVNPLEDDETVRKKYRKLALSLHPDKNKSLGAEGAFKLVSEAWSLLSDKAKRLAYNQKRNLQGFQQRVPSPSGPSAPPGANGFCNFTNSATLNERRQSNNTQVSPTLVPPSHQKGNTFWTVCNRCKTQYEYLKIYLNHNLICPNCHEAFLALEKAPPPNFSKSSNSSCRQHHNSRHNAANTNAFNPRRNCAVAQNSGPGGSGGLNSFNNTNFQWGPSSRMTGDCGTGASPSTVAQAASMVQQSNEKMKREREEAQAAAEWVRSHVSERMGNSAFKVKRPSKKRRMDGNCMNGYRGDALNQMPMGNGDTGFGSASGLGKGNIERIYGVSITNTIPHCRKELSFTEVRKMLMEKAHIEIRKKLIELSSINEAMTVDQKKEKGKGKEYENQKSEVNGSICDLSKHGELAVTNAGQQNKKFIPGTSDDATGKESAAPTSMNVPDPDFHNFDLDRTERSFGDDQVWAVYDDDDGMPRYYARIHKMISLKPFKMQISWLNSRSNSELGPLDWIGSGFSKTSGNFRVGKHEISNSLNSFSHQVKWTKGSRGAICIFPSKGDVWALYRNWSPDWNEHTPDEVVHKYDMVEVLEDYNKEQGVSVIPLVKVAGFRTVFHKHMEPKEVRRIPKEEMFRFSHQVPNHLLTGEEAQNVPMGCRELDPAATPVELLQLITETSEVLMVDNGGKTKEEMLESSHKIKVYGMVENASKFKEGEVIENDNQGKNEKIMMPNMVAKEAEVVDDAEKVKKLECEDC